MNKLYASLILVLVGATACLAQNEAKEVGLLLGDEKVFAPFCLRERDEIIGDVMQQTNNKNAQMYEIFFGAATEIADEVLSVEKRAVEEFARELKQPSEQVVDEPLPEEEVQRLIEEGKRAIQQKTGVFGRLVAAGQSMAGSVLYNAANSAIFVRLAKARSYMTKNNLMYGIVSICESVAKYEKKLVEDLEVTKAELAKEHADDAQLKQVIESMTIPQLKCNTPKYIARLNGFCEILQKGAGALMKMLGLGSDYKLPTGIETSDA